MLLEFLMQTFRTYAVCVSFLLAFLLDKDYIRLAKFFWYLREMAGLGGTIIFPEGILSDGAAGAG